MLGSRVLCVTKRRKGEWGEIANNVDDSWLYFQSFVYGLGFVYDVRMYIMGIYQTYIV